MKNNKEIILALKFNLKEQIANHINDNINDLSENATRIILNSIESYRKNIINKNEITKSNIKFLNFLKIKLLSKDYNITFSNDEIIREILKFEEGLAVRRIKFKIPLTDLIKAINILRSVLWSSIKNTFSDDKILIYDFFEAEKKINFIFWNFCISLTGSYTSYQSEMLEMQEKAFNKWEEVVKSAHNIELNMPAKEQFVAIGRLQAEALARRLNYDEEEVNDIKIAVGEACNNAIEHSKTNKGIDVHYHISMDKLLIEIRDYGIGFDPTGKGDLPDDLLAEGGRGLFLMKNLMDKVEIISEPHKGTLVSLYKKRKFQ